MLTQDYLKSLLDYDLNSGEFTWRISKGNAKAGARAGAISPDGYIRIGINNHGYLAHRLAWLYVYKEFPEGFVDHINGSREDNRVANLRKATPAESSQNTKKYSSNTSGFTGVVFNKKHKKYYARITCSGFRKHLGHFDTAESAFNAYKEAKQALHSFNPEAPLRGREGKTV